MTRGEQLKKYTGCVVLMVFILLAGCSATTPAIELRNGEAEEANMTLTEVFDSFGTFNNVPQKQIDKVVKGTKQIIEEKLSTLK